MPGEKFIQMTTGGNFTEKRGVQTGGSSNANKIAALDSAGKIANTMLPDGIGQDTVVIQASEALSAGQFINIWQSGSDTRVRRASASSTITRADGFVKEDVASGSDATIFISGINTNVEGSINVGGKVFLSATPGQGRAVPPTSVNNIAQYLGICTDDNTVAVDIRDFIIRSA